MSTQFATDEAQSLLAAAIAGELPDARGTIRSVRRPLCSGNPGTGFRTAR